MSADLDLPALFNIVADEITATHGEPTSRTSKPRRGAQFSARMAATWQTNGHACGFQITQYPQAWKIRTWADRGDLADATVEIRHPDQVEPLLRLLLLRAGIAVNSGDPYLDAAIAAATRHVEDLAAVHEQTLRRASRAEDKARDLGRELRAKFDETTLGRSFVAMRETAQKEITRADTAETEAKRLRSGMDRLVRVWREQLDFHAADAARFADDPDLCTAFREVNTKAAVYDRAITDLTAVLAEVANVR